jgi:hypothetical protein
MQSLNNLLASMNQIQKLVVRQQLSVSHGDNARIFREAAQLRTSDKDVAS